jgi:hypothetical protein
VTELVPVTLDYLDKVWPLVERFAREAMKHARGEDTPEMFLADCRRADAQIWLAAEKATVLAACGTSIDVRRDGNKVFNIRWLSGRDYDSWQHHFDRMKLWAASKGCTSLYYRGRPGWQRMRPQARVAGVIYEEAL